MSTYAEPSAEQEAELSSARRALSAAVGHLLGLQSEQGWWKAELETNVTMDAEDLMLRHVLGILEPHLARRAARWILSNQLDDGAWATFFGGPGDLSTTVEAYVALRLAGESPTEPHMQAAARFIRQRGGVGRSRVFTRIWLALLGAWEWDQLPVIPPEIMYVPTWAPLNIYDFACWARQTVVALTVVMSFRPVVPLPFDLEELRPEQTAPVERRSEGLGARAFYALDAAVRFYSRHLAGLPLLRDARAKALAKAEEWILARQEADGLWGGIQPPVVYSIIALHLLGYDLGQPCMAKALEGLEGFVIEDERGRRIEACQSPVWDTALAVVALADAGLDAQSDPLRRACSWLLAEEVRIKGDWAVRRPNLAPGGWAFEFANDNYPDTDDTAEVVLALRRGGLDAEVGPACARAVQWVLGMRSSDGGWGAFDVDNTSPLVAALPFCDFGEVTDPPSADVTAHVLEMLAGERDVDPAVINAAVRWLLEHQEADGSWFGRWGVNYIYGTGAVLPALVAAGVEPSHPAIKRAVAWLEAHQNPDGGWGEDLRSYRDPAWKGRGTSTASQTAWALLALVAAGRAGSPAARRGAAWLADTQLESGTWDEPWYTGTGFPWDFSINYHLYRLVWPISALGRYLAAVEGSKEPTTPRSST